MAPSTLRKAIGVVKDQTSISLAKVGGSTSLSDLDVAIVKATRHEVNPAEERHIREILNLTSYSRSYVSACINTLSKRLNKTKNWTVALKTLILIQRLLAEGDPAYEQEIFFATRRGTRLLNMSDFRDTSQSDSWDYSAFVRTYALYLDERLEYKMQGRRGKRSMYGSEEEDEESSPGAICVKSTSINEIRIEHIFSKLQHLQQLLERFLACRPTGSAKNDRVVMVALYPIIKESFQIYYDITEILGILIDRIADLEISYSVKVYEIFCRVTKQFDELSQFYSWCKTVGVGRSSEYPEVEKIAQNKLDLMDEFIQDKLVLVQRGKIIEVKEEAKPKVKEPEPIEEDMNAIKALPPPEVMTEPTIKEEIEEIKQENLEDYKFSRLEDDLLNLGVDAMTSEEHTDKLALALFDSLGPTTIAGSVPALPWQAFNDDTTDWETTLVQSASNLPNQKVAMAGGFDMLMLNGMYQQGANVTTLGYGTTGSASSAALGSAGSPTILALPAPPTSETQVTATTIVDPFAASLAVAPPSFVQISDMEKKQRLLVEEQMMWEQYKRDGLQGNLGLMKQQQYPCSRGYPHRY
ncbi:hypothetical protein SLEP1_g18755 [Rubroshorea leprosula]|uniref:ENTH domain-containing protein n=1 Tax=Rubroshorea leprosula TaxID=152421 RepID=A0AAV5JAF6_9ROSI|nr:hypothetical protein SLEP1_g18755 [Rubroshorea leprosula]